MSEILKAFLKNEAGIRRHLKRFCPRASDLDDIVQETFLRGFAAETRRPIKEPKAYLYRIARNIALDKARRNSLVPMDSLEDSGGSSLILDENQAMADERLDGQRKLALFAEAVAHLPLQCRKAFLMRHVEGFPYKQIATRMNISVSTVEKHVTVGLLKCDSYLRSHGYEPSEFGSVVKSMPEEAPDASKMTVNKDE